MVWFNEIYTVITEIPVCVSEFLKLINSIYPEQAFVSLLSLVASCGIFCVDVKSEDALMSIDVKHTLNRPYLINYNTILIIDNDNSFM